MTVWLTEADRQAYMKALDTTVADLDIVDYLKILNGIDGVCTVSSCLGWHANGEGRVNFDVGFVILHLSEQKGRLLERAADDLSSFCEGLAMGMEKEWLYSPHNRPEAPCIECQPVECRGKCQPVVWHTVKFSGRVCLGCLRALCNLLMGMSA